MTGIDTDAKRLGLFGGLGQALDFRSAPGFVGIRLGERPSVQLDERAACSGGGLDLFRIGVDEKADLDARLAKRLGGGGDGVDLAGHIEPALGGDLSPVFRDEANGLRLEPFGDVDHLGRVGHFKIQPRRDSLAYGPDVTILNVTPILAQMGGDPVRPGSFAIRTASTWGKARPVFVHGNGLFTVATWSMLTPSLERMPLLFGRRFFLGLMRLGLARGVSAGLGHSSVGLGNCGLSSQRVRSAISSAERPRCDLRVMVSSLPLTVASVIVLPSFG